MQIEELSITSIKPYEKNPRKNDGAVNGVAESIRQFGFQQPIVIDANNVIVAGHTRYKAGLKLGLKTVPCVRADKLTKEQVKAYRILDNKLNELAIWDFLELSKELQGIDFDFSSFNPNQLFNDIEKIAPCSIVDSLSEAQDESNNDNYNYQNNEIKQNLQEENAKVLDNSKVNQSEKVKAEWIAMPPTENKNIIDRYVHLLVIFENVERKKEFGRLLNRNITEKTTFIYYPSEPARADTTKVGYV